MEIILTIIHTNLVTNCLIYFLFFLRYQKQELNFQQVCGLVPRGISALCLKGVALYFKVMPNSIDFYKRNFLHVIPARIIVPCFY